MIVVDTNLIAFLLIEGEWTRRARRLMEMETDWRIPVFWRYEMSNVLSNYVRFKGMPLTTAGELWRDAVHLDHVREMPVDLASALELTKRYGITAYDAQYVALALSLDVVCITGDRRLRKAVPTRVRMLDEIIKE